MPGRSHTITRDRHARRMMHLFRALGEDVAAELDRIGFLKPEKNPRPWRPGPHCVSGIPDVLYPYDPAVLRAWREFDPNVIPLIVRRAYVAPTGERRIYRFHAVGSHRWNPSKRPSPTMAKIMMPSNVYVPRPTHLDLHFEDRTERPGNGLPGEYIPFDWRIYHGMRALWQDWSAKQKIAFMTENDAQAKARRRREAVEADRAAYAAHPAQQRYVRGHLQKIDKDDVRRLRQKVYEPERAITITVP